MNASKHTYVKTPFTGFERCIVFCQIVHHTAGLCTEQMFIIVPCSDKGIPILNSSLLLIASEPTKRTLMPLSLEQAQLALDMLFEVLSNSEGQDELLDRDILEAARTSLRNTQILSEPVVRLTEKFSILITQNRSETTTLWAMRVEISGISMIPVCFEFIGFRGSDDSIKVIFNIEETARDELKLLRLLDDVLIYVDHGNGMERQYTGVCTKLEISDSLLVMIIESFAYDLSKSRIGHLSTLGLSHLDLVHLIGRNSGLEERQLNIEGFSPNRKAFTVTVPILNMNIIEPMGFANVMFYPPNHSLAEVPRILEVANEGNPVFETNTLALVHIEADTLYEALKIGVNKIEQVLDVLLYIVRADTIFKGGAIESIFGSWELDDLTPHPIVSTWVHIEEPFSGGKIVMDTSRIEQPDLLVIRTGTQNVLEQMEWCESLFRELEETGEESIKRLLNAFKWLRRSWDANDYEDKIIFANIALEFIASGEPSPPVIPQEFIKQVKRAAVDKFDELYQGENKEHFKKELNEKLGFTMKSAPLRIQIEGLIERNHIPVNDSDMATIFEGRKIRNDLVHGRGANKTFTKTQNRKMVNAIGILASHKLKSFFKEGST